MRGKILLTFGLLICLAIGVKAQVTFKGGQLALDRFLTDHIVYPEYSRQNCIAATIQVKFRVDARGQVTDVTIQQGLGIDLDDEAMRVVKLTSGQWQVTADYNNSNIILPITFHPDNTRCGAVNQAGMNMAIANYKSQEALQDAVTNYYKNKYAGKADVSKEPEIIALKKQLGYDDDFINDVLDQADKKLKQGDKAGACLDWNFIHNIGSDKADPFIAKYCN